MRNFWTKIPFLLELLINGSFAFFYLLIKSEKDVPFFPLDKISHLMVDFAFLPPLIVFIGMVFQYLQTLNVESFIRKNLFSFIVFVPMLLTYGDLEFSFWLIVAHLASSILGLYEVQHVNQFDSSQKKNY